MNCNSVFKCVVLEFQVGMRAIGTRSHPSRNERIILP